MKNYYYNDLSKKEVLALCERKNISNQEVIDVVAKIEREVVSGGDKSLFDMIEKFDGAGIVDLKISEKELKNAKIDDELAKAIKIAYKNIYKFHQKNFLNDAKKLETSEGIFCWKAKKAIEKVGLYIPSGTAPLFSTLLMLAVPAIIAKCSEIYICSPVNKNGEIAPEILWVANFLNLKNIFKIGGAGAIFALSYGTETVPKVDKIFGPGNSYVTVAKQKIVAKTAIDMPAGPSEVLVIADKESNASFVASDLLSQAEHGNDSRAILVSDSEFKIEEVMKELAKQKKLFPVRKNIIELSLKNSFSLLVDNLNDAIKFSNIYAPEHLILSLENYQEYLAKIINAGSVFCGKYTSESLGDYASGTNHTLPTSGFAKSFSGISVDSFCKNITFQTATKEGLENIAKTIEIMAEKEGLLAHKNSITIRK